MQMQKKKEKISTLKFKVKVNFAAGNMYQLKFSTVEYCIFLFRNIVQLAAMFKISQSTTFVLFCLFETFEVIPCH